MPTALGTDVYLLGVFATRVARQPERSFTDLVSEAYVGALADADISDASCLRQAWFSCVFMDFWGQSAGTGQATLTPLMRDGRLPAGTPIVNVEAGCASASVALNGALKDVRSGFGDVALAIGVEKMNDPDRPGAYLTHMERAVDQLNPASWQELYRALARRSGADFAPTPERSLAIDVYSVWAHSHMAEFGTTKDQIAAAAAKNHTNAVANPRAQYRFAMTVEDVLEDRLIVEPLTRAMCAPTGDAAAAAIVCSGNYLKSVSPEARDRALRIRGHALAGGTFDAGWRDRRAPVIAANLAYTEAGMRPSDVNLVELHDATSFAEIHLVEDLGLCARGDGGPFTASGGTAADGTTPVNLSGGLVSRGHPIGATGIVMLNELALQLRGEAGEMQLQGATVGLAENGGGMVGNDVAVSAVTILERQ